MKELAQAVYSVVAKGEPVQAVASTLSESERAALMAALPVARTGLESAGPEQPWMTAVEPRPAAEVPEPQPWMAAPRQGEAREA